MPQYLLKRRLLAQSSVADCLALLRGAAVVSPGNYVLAERGGRLLDVELTPGGVETLDAEDDLIVHANHYAHPQLQVITPRWSDCPARRAGRSA